MLAGDLLPTVKKLCASYIEEIGSTDGDQNVYIFQYISHALSKLAGIARQCKDSDQLTISTDGYYTFKRGIDITNMYAPIRILDPNGRNMDIRTSFTDKRGWYRDSSNTQIHIKGYSLPTDPLPQGTHILQYIAYPNPVTSVDTVVEFPDAGRMGLCYYSAALIVESLDDSKDLAMHYYGLADSHNEVVIQANIEARGTYNGFIPSMVNAQYYRNRK